MDSTLSTSLSPLLCEYLLHSQSTFLPRHTAARRTMGNIQIPKAPTQTDLKYFSPRTLISSTHQHWILIWIHLAPGVCRKHSSGHLRVHIDQQVAEPLQSRDMWKLDVEVAPKSKHKGKLSKNCCLCFTGSYRCVFILSSPFHTEIHTAKETVSVFPLHVTPNFEDIDVTCNSPEVQTKGLLLSCCCDRHLKSLKVSWKVNGTINITGKINKRLSFTC